MQDEHIFQITPFFRLPDASQHFLRLHRPAQPHATILREYRSITHVRYTNPSSAVQIYVISVHHTVFGCSGLNSLFNRLCNVDEKSLLIVVLVLGWIYLAFIPISRI